MSSDSQTKIIPAKRLEELRAESRRLEDLRVESRELEVDVDVVFDENEDGTGGAASRRGPALDPLEALEALESEAEEQEANLGQTAARVFDPAELDAAVAGAATTQRVWAVTVSTRAAVMPVVREDEVENLDEYEEVGDEDAGEGEVAGEDEGINEGEYDDPADDGWDDNLDSVPLQLSSKKGQTPPPPLGNVVPSATGSIPRPMLRTSGAPPKKV